jgi:1-pyrroline-5-carboxylate dehydrogenase
MMMNNSIFRFSKPANEPVKEYKPGTGERCGLIDELNNLSGKVIDIPLIIGGKEIRTGKLGQIKMPHNHEHVLANYHMASEEEVEMAVEAAISAHHEWSSISWVERVSISLKAADLIAGKYRNLVNASTMLGQSKNIFQAEIDAVCETVDFLRFNAYYLSEIYHQQPESSAGIINRIEYRPLEGFVFAVSPFNFTSIACNLNMAPAIMGNTLLWKPSATAVYSNYFIMKILMEAGLPSGVINFIPGKGSLIGDIVLKNRNLAGVHFTGSTEVFNSFWTKIGANISNYKSYPKIVGETGGKDFIVAHNSAGKDELATAMIRGAFEYQGQKCSAASRAYIPISIWPELKTKLEAMIHQIKIGDITEFGNFMNAVIDLSAFNRISDYINYARKALDAEIMFGGGCSAEKGYFIEPTIIVTKNPHFKTMEEEIFGPVLTVYLYNDEEFDSMLSLCDSTSPYGLTGSVFSSDRSVLDYMAKKLKYAAGNLYYNDKPTGAVVGQQPFGGARASGTNDKAGSSLNLMRWTSPRTIKETLVPPTDFKYPFMEEGKCK